jgi:hypothetical protein
MNKLLLGIALAAGLSAGGANAATLDFMGYANAGEQGVASGTSITSAFFGGQTLTFTSNFNPYFDGGNAGLGVCKVLTSGAQCDPGNDDNVNALEMVTVAFTGLSDLSKILLRAEGHVPLGDSVSIVFGTDVHALATYTYGVLKGMSFAGISSMTFAYADTARTADQFYVQSAVVTSPVPLPAGAPLLLGALGALGFAASRRRKQSV